jgi:polar amino acid transport system substrate-binding protein
MTGRYKWFVALVAELATVALAFAGCTTPSTQSTTPPVEGTKAPATGETTPPNNFKLVTPGTLTVGSDTNFPPFESINGTKPEGFDVDLLAAIAKGLGLKMVYLSENWDTLIPTLKAGSKFDVVSSGMTIKADKAKEVDFSRPYMDSNQSIAMKAGGVYNKPSDLKGKKVGAQSATTGMDWANENLKPAGATTVPFKTTTDAFAALQAGNVAAVVNDLPVTENIVRDKSRGLVIVKEIPTGEQYGIAVSKDNPELLKAINAQLAKLKADGTWAKLYQKWLSDSVPIPPK